MTRDRSQPLGLPARDSSSREAAATTDSRPSAVERWLAGRLIRAAAGAEASLALWDGETVSPERNVAGRVEVHDRGALWRLLVDPEMAFGDLYCAGRVTVEGDLVAVLEAVLRRARESGTPSPWRRALRPLTRLPAPTPSRSRAEIHHHYDLGNEFYEMWLDAGAMQYTCAYYPDEGMTLEEAQRAKMDHVCRKLWLEPGETVVEAGCGWGGFALHMARHYGVTVRAFNISSEQIAYARERAERDGLDDRVEFVEDDYRNITGRYDVFASIGMLEHVGQGNYRALGRVVDRCLESDGRGLIHTIGRDRPTKLNPWMAKRIFPGARPPTLGEMSAIFEPAGLSVLDVENLRLHYAETLRAWLRRFEDRVDDVGTMFDEPFVRAWRLYLASSIAAFTSGSMQLFQVLFARSGGNAIPPSRAHVYAPPSGTG